MTDCSGGGSQTEMRKRGDSKVSHGDNLFGVFIKSENHMGRGGRTIEVVVSARAIGSGA